MNFEVRKASDWYHTYNTEINSLDELMEFIKKNGDIVLDEDSIIIYDTYIE